MVLHNFSSLSASAEAVASRSRKLERRAETKVLRLLLRCCEIMPSVKRRILKCCQAPQEALYSRYHAPAIDFETQPRVPRDLSVQCEMT